MAADMTIDQILRDLNYCDNQFPHAAWQAALQRRDEIIPKLTDAIDDATYRIEDDQIVATWGHVAALFLLTEFGEREAFPVILKSMCCSEPHELYSSFISEDLPQIAARLAGNPDMLADAIDDRDVNDSVRCALVAAVFGMVCEKRISRDQAILFFLDRMDLAADEKDQCVMTTCVEMLGQLHAEEARRGVQLAVDSGLVDEEVLGIDYFGKQLARGQAAFDEACGFHTERRKLTASEYLQQLPLFNQETRHPQHLAEALLEIQKPSDWIPADAIRWARKHRDEITPHLIRIIDELTEFIENDVDDGTAGCEGENEFDHDDQEGRGYIIALYLLTEFGAREALPAILCAVCHSDPRVSDRFQDVIGLDLAQMLGRLADTPEQLQPMADDPDLDDFLRRDAVDAIVWMVTEGKLDRNKAIELLQVRFQESRDRSDSVLSTWIAAALMDLGASDARASVLDAWESGELDDDWLWSEVIEEALADGNDSFNTTCENSRKDRIEHTVVELQAWDWDGSRAGDSDFDDDSEGDWDDDDDDDDDEEDEDTVDPEFKKMWLGLRQKYSDSELVQLLQARQEMDCISDVDGEDSFSRDAPTTIRNTEPKVGRNDPCPCGSGKKYKKCCVKADN